VILEGRVSIEAAIKGQSRPVVEILAVQPGDRRFAYLRRLAAEHEIPIRRVAAAELAGVVTGTSHGGVVALAGQRRHLTVEELMGGLAANPLVFMLDGVEDPFNYGQAIRSIFAAGADGLIVRERSWQTAAGTVARASAGASELIPTASTPNAELAAELARGAGMSVACATTSADATWIHDANLAGPVLIVIGGERRGVTRSFIDEADLRLRIPYGRRGAHALGVAATAAVIAFEALRQRRLASAGLRAEQAPDTDDAGASAARRGR
jgi:23S rRNA (guanosine2251-2'-O)-methyltransferase